MSGRATAEHESAEGARVTVSWLFLVAALIGVWFTAQSLRPVPLPSTPSMPRLVIAVASFFAGWLTNELVFHHFAWQVLATGAFVAAGGLESWPGWIALALVIVSWAGMVLVARDVVGARSAVRDAFTSHLDPTSSTELAGLDLWAVTGGRLVVPWWTSQRRVQRTRNVVFTRASGRDLTLDVFSPRDDGDERRPALIYLHGGAWVLGFRERQGLPLLNEFASRGWVGIQPSYRLSPGATFPEHLIDVKRAIAWVRDHADELRVDPSFLAIAGGSAGGHLASLAALTPHRSDLQPGFEDADTRVQACVSFYGVYDMGGVAGDKDPTMDGFLERIVMKAAPNEAPQRYALASPRAQISECAPPFLVLHGARDSLTPPRNARSFAARLRETSSAPVVDVELPGTQHAFDMFASVRTTAVLRGVVHFLERAQHRALSIGGATDSARTDHAPPSGTGGLS